MKILRSEKNPIIKTSDLLPGRPDFEIIGVFNCGVAKYDGKTVLLLRVATRAKADAKHAKTPYYNAQKEQLEVLDFDRSDPDIDFSDVRFIKTKEQLYLTSVSHIRLAISDDGVNFTDQGVFITGDSEYEEFGVEDPRITFIDGWYYINYSAISRFGVFTMLARTKDFKKVEKKGIIFLADNKDVVIFPQKIRGRYCALHRPVSAYFNRPEMWISYSDDLLSYKEHNILCKLRPGYFDSSRLGASCVPFLTKHGWLEIYHGCNEKNEYCLGALLLDKDYPEQIIARSETPIFLPEAEYETQGFMPNVIFSCGALVDGDELSIYYGSCDESICLAKMSINEILESMKRYAKAI
jgi:predicted GH43/DUF377 family glycosyl hydrolase